VTYSSFSLNPFKTLKHSARYLILALTALLSISAHASETLPTVGKDIARRIGTIHVLYNNRICPLNTVATDFAIKMTDSASWHGYSADEIFVSWMIYYTPWEKELLLNNQRKGANEREAAAEMFYSGQLIRIFPYRIADQVNWYSPGGQVLPREIPVKEQFFIKQSMDYLTEAIVTGQHDRAVEIIEKIKLFQREMAGDLLPSEHKTQAELFYNKLRSIRFPVFITAQLALRWWLSGHVPLTNGYETMLFMAWVLLVLTVVLYFLPSLLRRGRGRGPRIIIVLGPLAACCCLAVAAMAGSESELTPLTPALQSPYLTSHVSSVMCSYALFALQMLLGLWALFLIIRKSAQLNKVTALSRHLLYPAVILLATGIIIGSIWAKEAWGSYWSWDPKETWALITLIVYTIPLIAASIPAFRKPLYYHLYMVFAFLSVIITYFGVNYLLGGMHSYV